MSDCGTNAGRAPSLPVNGFDHGQMERMCAGKKVYPSRRVAKRWAKLRGLSVYRCRICGGYHLTSQRRRKASKKGIKPLCQKPAKSTAGRGGVESGAPADQNAKADGFAAAALKEQVIL